LLPPTVKGTKISSVTILRGEEWIEANHRNRNKNLVQETSIRDWQYRTSLNSRLYFSFLFNCARIPDRLHQIRVVPFLTTTSDSAQHSFYRAKGAVSLSAMQTANIQTQVQQSLEKPTTFMLLIAMKSTTFQPPFKSPRNGGGYTF
jgi:hypothetical protein